MSAIAVKVDENDKVDITLEKLNEFLKDAYDEGYKAGRDSVPYISPLTTPTYPQSPTTPISPYWYCTGETKREIPCNEPNQTGTDFIKDNSNISLS